jgi:class 3 adenylate cyclase
LKNYFISLKIREEIEHKPGIVIAHHTIGDIYYKQGNFPQALEQVLKSVEKGEEINNKLEVRNSCRLLTNILKEMGDFAGALNYHEKYHALESEILGEDAQKQLTNLSFMHNLEQKEKDLEIEHLRNVELKNERDRSENLLLNILPSEVAEELKEKGTANAKLFDDVTVLFTDFVGFTKVSERLTPQQLVDELHACFSAFDAIMEKHNIEKIKTVGDAYLAVSGLPLANNNHAENLVKAAIEIRDFMRRRKLETENSKLETFEIRIGVHSGSVVAGIVGVKKFAYDIWGDTVNTAARMEQNSKAGKINISHTTHELVKNKFTCQYRGEIDAKNKGLLKMYFVE